MMAVFEINSGTEEVKKGRSFTASQHTGTMETRRKWWGNRIRRDQRRLFL